MRLSLDLLKLEGKVESTDEASQLHQRGSSKLQDKTRLLSDQISNQGDWICWIQTTPPDQVTW